jgi:hypothetical protein
MDELEVQLKRYADAAEQRVPPTPAERPDRSRGRLLAVAAVIAVLGGSVGVFALARGTDDRVDTVPADTTIDRPEEPCPVPADEPRPHHLQLEPTTVANAKVERSNLGSTTASEVFTVFVGLDGEDFIEVRVREIDESTDYLQPRPGTDTVQVRVCDPFEADRNPREVTGTFAENAIDRSVTFSIGDRWSVSLRTAPPGESTHTLDDLIDVVAGVTWPAPSERPASAATVPAISNDDCSADPEVAIGLGSLTVTVVPDGYEPKLPVEIEDSGVPVDLGGTSSSSLTLLHPRKGHIQVTSFRSPDPATYIDEQIAIGDVDHANVRMCGSIEGRLERSDHLVTVVRSGATLAAAGQTREYEGFLVLGPAESEAEILEIVAGLRLPFS